MIKSSDFRISETVRAIFSCDEKSISLQFACDVPVGDRMTFTRDEAVTLGTRIAETGSWDKFPVNGVPVEAVKNFGHRLRAYGRHGS